MSRWGLFSIPEQHIKHLDPPHERSLTIASFQHSLLHFILLRPVGYFTIYTLLNSTSNFTFSVLSQLFDQRKYAILHLHRFLCPPGRRQRLSHPPGATERRPPRPNWRLLRGQHELEGGCLQRQWPDWPLRP